MPLSRQALDLLAEARQHGNGSGLIFPSARGKVQEASRLRKMRGDLKISGTPHGVRSSLRDWCTETGVSFEVTEAILAHQEKSATVRTYVRSDLLEQRRPVMQQTDTFCSVTVTYAE